VAVVLSYNEYQRMVALEDQYWLLKAQAEKQESFLNHQDSEAFLQGLLSA
jgi:hypothetical protein